ncbi:N-acetylmuramoyl-L-alanine amidase [Roseateles sp. LKC17W]|uniref:N-acetylmuramoyl-L-alanine amidase n=1 Tax=Pelomonas margarita TaxID=3299031 RepID=A0ABW7FFG4_9BURK
MAKCPFAQWKPITNERGCGRYLGGPFKIVHHTTQGDTANSAFTTFAKRGSDPHFTVDAKEIYQHVDTDYGALALKNAKDGVETNRDSAVQIELVGYAERAKDRDALKRVARLCRWIEATHGVPRVWPAGVPRPAKEGKDPGGHIRDAFLWDATGGHYGHSQVPENSHWDPAYTAEEASFVLAAEFDELGDLLVQNFVQPAEAPDKPSRLLATITNDGVVSVIMEDPDGRVHFTADADIDADGANGQNGAPWAYRADDSGSDALANAGMARIGGKVVCKHAWARSVVLLDVDNEPKVFPGGGIASCTWYRHSGKAKTDPSAYVDSETVAYVVVPPVIVQKTQGVVRGCRALVTYRGKTIECVVADKGPANKIGELSIAAARQLGIPSSPRSGGVSGPNVHYELWPGIPAEGFELQPA